MKYLITEIIFPSVIDQIVILIQSYIIKGNVFTLEINYYNVKSSIAKNIVICVSKGYSDCIFNEGFFCVKKNYKYFLSV